MPRLRAGLGITAGLLMLLSSAAHSLLGWSGLGAQLAAAHVPADLLFAVKVGWHFGGAAMLAFGVILVTLFARRWKGASASPFPAVVIAFAYLSFGLWALVASGFRPFFLVFVVPAILVLAACPEPRRAG